MPLRLLVRLALFTALVPGLALARPAAVDPRAMSADEYKVYRDYQSALKDPRVQKMPAPKRLPAIARNFHLPETKLERIVAVGEKSADGLVKANEAAARAALERSPLAGRISSVELVDQLGRVVAYVSWKNLDKARLPQEASHVAKTVVQAAPLVSIVAVWSCMGTTKTFTAKIRASAAEHIDEARIEDFAATRYLRLFEDVHDLFTGRPPEDASGCGG